MPFAALHLPSIALTQLRAVVAAELEGRVATEIHNANHDFTTYFGSDAYGEMTDSVKSTVAGFGDWLAYAWTALRADPLGLLSYAVSVELPIRISWMARKYHHLLFRPPKPDKPPSQLDLAILKVRNAIAGAYISYAPDGYEGSIDYFMNCQRARLPHDKWSESAKGGVRMHFFPGDPTSTFEARSLSALSKKVNGSQTRLQQDVEHETHPLPTA